MAREKSSLLLGKFRSLYGQIILTWEEASETCQKYGEELPSFSSMEDIHIFIAMLLTCGKHNKKWCEIGNSFHKFNDHFYIGLKKSSEVDILQLYFVIITFL